MRGMKPLSDDECARIAAAFCGTHAPRNRCLFAMGLNLGFRVSELLSLDIGSVLDETGSLRSAVTVGRMQMKGKKEPRSVVVNEACAAALWSYLKTRQTDGTLRYGLPLFLTDRLQRMTRATAWQSLTTAYQLAGLNPRGIGTHGLRKTFAIRVYQYFLQLSKAAPGRVDALRYTKEALRHQNLDSTLCYLPHDGAIVDAGVMAIGRL